MFSCRWSCCIGDSVIYKVRSQLKPFLNSSKAEMFTVGLVVLNTFVLALEKEPKTPEFDEFLNVSNNVRLSNCRFNRIGRFHTF